MQQRVVLEEDAERRQKLVRYAVPFVVIYVPYYAWRILYYGDFFPYTYYAKSADQSYFEQGGVYIVGFLIGSGFLLALPGHRHTRRRFFLQRPAMGVDPGKHGNAAEAL